MAVTFPRAISLLAIAALVACGGCARSLDYSTRAALREDVAPGGFPADGRLVRCRVTDVSGGYMQVAHPEACSFLAVEETRIPLRTVDRPAEGQPSAYSIHIRRGDGPLPYGLRKGAVVTLRFLRGGEFFDVKEWTENPLPPSWDPTRALTITPARPSP